MARPRFGVGIWAESVTVKIPSGAVSAFPRTSLAGGPPATPNTARGSIGADMSAEPTPMSTHSSPTKKCRVDGGCVPATPPSLTKSSRENESPANGPHSGKNSPGADDAKEPRISNGSSVPEDARVSESSDGDAPLDVETVAEEARGGVGHGDDEEVR